MLRLTSVRAIRVGRLGIFDFLPGWYLYVGSAFGPGGVRARCAHHRQLSSKPRWHIDNLRAQTAPEEVWFSYDPVQREHQWAGILSRMCGVSEPVRRFGASDCDCSSHLFYLPDKPDWHGFAQQVEMQLSEYAVIKCKDF
ncbi:MAG: GIY-YIG nuclease family protein [Gammaproteobacteria bacterium]|nr:GIY-YIG nuclease family protein [Gammaproteobacteria bacterium]